MAYYSEPAILNTWRNATGRGEGSGRSELLAALNAGEPRASAILEEAGNGIGRHLANLVNVTDPEVIVVGGEAVAFGDALFGPLRATLEKNTFRAPPPVLPDWEDNSWARGAAALVTQKIFDFETSAGNASPHDVEIKHAL